QDPAFTISGLPQYTEHRNAIILVNKLLNIFSHQQLEQFCDFYQCAAEQWLKLIGVFILLRGYEAP
ncbi:unnamed protein product, partial [Staurois parvus]